ncbi:MAG: hypothetical protein HYY52_02280 [Candidatus Melainabacteria bacterium]|nr:hypothetical protein [Candidatus Melainabacteria bacterium]
MSKKVIIAAFLSSIVGIVIFYLVADLLGTQILLKNCYCAQEGLLRHPNLLSRDPNRALKYFVAFLLTNTLWAYVFSVRQNAFSGSGIEKGIKFFLLLWFLTIPVHFWSWIFITYSKKILLYNVFVYYLALFLGTGVVIGKVCSEK